MIAMYFMVVLYAIAVDAMMSELAGIRFKVRVSIMWCLIWPVTSVLLIFAVLKKQKKKEMKNENRNASCESR